MGHKENDRFLSQRSGFQATKMSDLFSVNQLCWLIQGYHGAWLAYLCTRDSVQRSCPMNSDPNYCVDIWQNKNITEVVGGTSIHWLRNSKRRVDPYVAMMHWDWGKLLFTRDTSEEGV